MQEWMITWGPIISAIIGGVFTLIGAYLQISKPESPKPIITMLSLVFIVVAISTTWFLWEPKSQWDIWSDRIASSIKSCIKKGNSDINCVQNGLEQNVKLLPPINDNNNAAASFYHDIKAGEILMSIEEVRNVFSKYLGINPSTFIGSGSTIPWGAEYKNAQAREYLIPNYQETHKFVWTWKISPEQVAARGMTIKEFIEKTPPDPASNADYDIAKAKKTLYEVLYDPTAQPPVVRFQQFSEKKYKGTIGRPEAHRVFAISLADVLNMKLEHAIRATGFTWDPTNYREKDTKLFMWLVIPFHNSEVEPATWGKVIGEASNWLKDGHNADK